LKVADFDYELPRHLIAQHPLPERDLSRLMVLHRASRRIEHRRFRDLPDYLQPGDLLVLNDTRVIPARLVGTRATGGRVELLLIRPHGDAWRAMVKCRGRLVPGEQLSLEGGALACRFLERLPGGEAVVAFDLEPDALMAKLDQVGRAPLPPYIKRPKDHDPEAPADKERYQTVYARRPGAVAAPTAGLHFTERLLAALEAKGVERTTVTLHVGPGTFKPVRVERVEDHEMHAEWFEFPEAAARAIARARNRGGKIVAVGTTSTRVLEAAAREGHLSPRAGWTDLFIYPGFEFRLTDALVTNFHLPRSTLLMLVSAFAGREFILEAYEEAKRLGYRFYSYGDAMLIL